MPGANVTGAPRITHAADSEKLRTRIWVRMEGGTDGPKIKDAIKSLKFINVMGKTVTFDDHNSAGHWVVLQAVKDKKVIVADIVEVK